MNKDQVYIVTGASSGIGMAIARALGSRGCTVVAHGRRATRLKDLGREITNYRWTAGDLTEDGACEDLIDKAVYDLGRLDGVINCAGKNHTASIQDVDIQSVIDMVRINVESAFKLTYISLKYFQQQGFGELVHITSVMGYKVRETGGAYSGTKHALEALCEALRMELARTKIRISCIAPGLVQTELHRDQAVHPSVTRGIDPLTPNDVANTLLWLLEHPGRINIPQIIMLPKGHVI